MQSFLLNLGLRFSFLKELDITDSVGENVTDVEIRARQGKNKKRSTERYRIGKKTRKEVEIRDCHDLKKHYRF